VRQITKAVMRSVALLTLAVSLAGCQMELFANLDQKQANEIIATLFRHGIPAERAVAKNGRYTVKVDEARFAESIAILNRSGLPRQEFASMGEVFKNEGIVASPVQERAQMIYALSQELARTVSEIDGVLSARVHLVLPENDPLRQQLIPSSASVFIRHHASMAMNDMLPRVKMLVANSVAGLSYDKVSVVNIPVAAADQDVTASTEPALESFFGVWMHRDSVGRAETILYGLLALLAAIGAAAGYFAWNRRQKVYPLAGNSRSEA
jgi:type III secretion protein J